MRKKLTVQVIFIDCKFVRDQYTSRPFKFAICDMLTRRNICRTSGVRGRWVARIRLSRSLTLRAEVEPEKAWTASASTTQSRSHCAMASHAITLLFTRRTIDTRTAYWQGASRCLRTIPYGRPFARLIYTCIVVQRFEITRHREVCSCVIDCEIPGLYWKHLRHKFHTGGQWKNIRPANCSFFCRRREKGLKTRRQCLVTLARLQRHSD